jgi:hypothetical protein
MGGTPEISGKSNAVPPNHRHLRGQAEDVVEQDAEAAFVDRPGLELVGSGTAVRTQLVGRPEARTPE